MRLDRGGGSSDRTRCCPSRSHYCTLGNRLTIDQRFRLLPSRSSTIANDGITAPAALVREPVPDIVHARTARFRRLLFVVFVVFVAVARVASVGTSVPPRTGTNVDSDAQLGHARINIHRARCIHTPPRPPPRPHPHPRTVVKLRARPIVQKTVSDHGAVRRVEVRPGALEQVARPLVRWQVLDLLYELLVRRRLRLVGPPLAFRTLAFPLLLNALQLHDLLLRHRRGAVPRPLLRLRLRLLSRRFWWGKPSRELRLRVGAFERLVWRSMADEFLGRISIVIRPPGHGHGRKGWRRSGRSGS